MAKGSHNLADVPWTALEFHEQPSLVFEWAERNEHFALLQRLVSFGDLKRPERLFQMHRYAVLGKVNEMCLFVDYDLNFNIERLYLSCVLTPATIQGHLEIMQMLLAAGANLEYACPYEEQNALQAAADSGNLNMVHELVVLGADVNAPPDVLRMSYPIDCEMLNQPDYYGNNLVTNLDRYGIYGRTGLQAAARAGHIDTVKYLIKAKASVNTLPSWSKVGVALQAAAENGSLEIVPILLEAGAMVNVAHTPGAATALQAAASSGDLDIFEKLVEVGADVNDVNSQIQHGYRPTALSKAAWNGHLTIVRKLLDAKAFIDPFGDKSQLNPLQEAVRGGHSHIVRELLNNNANPNAVADGFGRTALQIAAEAGHLEIVCQLLDAKADVNATTKRPGKTLPALHLANIGGHLEVVALLKSYRSK